MLPFSSVVSALVQQSKILRNFVGGCEAGFALNGAVNNLNVRMYVPAYQPPDFHYDVNDSRQKFIAWIGLCKRRYVGYFFR